MKQRIWPYPAVFLLMSIIWTAYVVAGHYTYWRDTGQEMPGMASSIRNGVLVVLGLVVIVFGARFAWLQRASAASEAVGSSTAAKQEAPAVVASGFNGSPAMLARSGADFVLEVRGAAAYAGGLTNGEIWQRIAAKADNHATVLSTNPDDYPNNDADRMAGMNIATAIGFGDSASHAVDYWPVPVIVWGPPKGKTSAARAATAINDGRQQAGLGVTLFLWQDDANTDDGAAMIGKLFQFFDQHPDVPAALVYSYDGWMLRSLLETPGSHKSMNAGRFVPPMPDSACGLLVTRSDRVDRLIRPYAVEQTEAINKNTTEYDVIKLWNFYWALNNDRGPESFDAQFKQREKDAGVLYPVALGVMSTDWWQAHLPELWKTIGNQGPGQFTPTPYIPVRWTTWQVKQFDKAPLFGYLHRPVDVKLTDDHGLALKTAEQAQALEAGWTKAVAALPGGEEPKRVFYDTTGDKQWVIPLNQALAQAGKGAPSLDEVKEGFDIGARIGNTGVSSPLLQIGLGLIASYDGGGASATVNRRPNGTASIVMVSPPDTSAKAAWAQKNNGADPFKATQ